MPNTKINFSSYNHILNLFSETDENDYLMIPGWYYDSEDESEIFYSCEMKWNEKDSKEFAEFFKGLESDIRAIATLDCKLRNDENNAEEVLGKDLYPIWKTYLAPFKAELNDEIFEKDFNGEELTEDEQEILGQYRTAIHKEARERLNKKDFSYDVIIRAMRFFRLLTLGAPEIIIDNELKTLTEAYIMHKYCLSLTKVQGVIG